METPVLVIHIAVGLVAMLSGYTALFLRKGAYWHRNFGRVFVGTMMILGVSTCYLGYVESSEGDFYAGLLILYLATTGWRAVKTAPGRVGLIEYAAFLFIAFIVGASVYSSYMAATSETGLYKEGSAVRHALFAVFFGTWLAGDLNNILRRGLRGKPRLLRHLWRMSFAVFVAAGPIFIARIHVFPDFISTTSLRFVVFALPFVPVFMIVVWALRFWLSKKNLTQALLAATPTRAGASE